MHPRAIKNGFLELYGNWISHIFLDQSGTDYVISGYKKSDLAINIAYMELIFNTISIQKIVISEFLSFESFWSVCRSLYVDLCFDIYLEKSSSWKCRLKTIRLTSSYKKSHTKTFVLFNSPVHNIHEIKFWKKISIIKKLQTKPTFAWKFWICSNKK